MIRRQNYRQIIFEKKSRRKIMFLGLELGSWAEWVTGIGSILAISAGFCYRKHDKKLQIKIKG